MASPNKPYPPISSTIPPLLLGTAAFNFQFNPSPSSLPTHSIIQHALDSGLLGFDTSPYYGPAEAILGASLTDPDLCAKHPRESYFLSTKVGRISAEEFDYSPAWVRRSVSRSVARLGAGWLDLVLCHDVEFVTAAEVLSAIMTLRELRRSNGGGGGSGGNVRYIGISGYPVDVLCDLAELVLRETGEPLDAVMSYANFTVQNTRLHSAGVLRLKAAGVATVLNASPLGMGLLRSNGVPLGAMGDWHPAPPGLREACAQAAQFCEQSSSSSASASGGEPLAKVALRYALEEWLRVGADAGLGTAAPFAKTQSDLLLLDGTGGGGGGGGARAEQLKGVSVCGVSYLGELVDTLDVLRSVLLAAGSGTGGSVAAAEAARREKERTQELVEGVRRVLGPWLGYAWDSPGKDFVRKEPRHDNDAAAAAADDDEN